MAVIGKKNSVTDGRMPILPQILLQLIKALHYILGSEYEKKIMFKSMFLTASIPLCVYQSILHLLIICIYVTLISSLSITFTSFKHSKSEKLLPHRI